MVHLVARPGSAKIEATLCVIKFLHTVPDSADSKALPVMGMVYMCVCVCVCVCVLREPCKRSEMVLQSLVSIYGERCGRRKKRLVVSFHLGFPGK